MLPRLRCDLKLKRFFSQTFSKIRRLQIDYLPKVFSGQRAVEDRLVEPVQNSGLKLRRSSAITARLASSEISPFSFMPSSR